MCHLCVYMWYRKEYGCMEHDFQQISSYFTVTCSLISCSNKIIFIIYLFLILIFTYKNFPKSEKNRTILLFLLAPLVSIYFHRQDSVFAILICALLLPKINQYFSVILIFLLLHTGTYNAYFLVQLLFGHAMHLQSNLRVSNNLLVTLPWLIETL